MNKNVACLALVAIAQISAAPPKAAEPVPAAADASDKNVVELAVSSPDHTTLVAAVKAADLVVSLTNPGPMTVFAPTNAAFDKLPKGTVEGLLKPDKIPELKKILQHHVAVSTYQLRDLARFDGKTLGQADGTRITIHVKDGKVLIDDANIVASFRVSNGIVHVIDAVLLPPAKQ